MNQDEKIKIQAQIKSQAQRPGWSQAKVAIAAGVSKATISDMVNGKWDLIRDEMWRKVSAALIAKPSEWRIAETADIRILHRVFRKAQKHSMSVGVSHQAGSGKTAAARTYVAGHDNAYHLICAQSFTSRLFLIKLGKAMGLDVEGLRTWEVIETITSALETSDKPLLILDEVDKLNDRTLLFFIEFYNRLEDKCGFILMGAPYLRLRIEKGAIKDKMGFREILSRLGKKFLPLKGAELADIELICRENGIETKAIITEIFNEYRDAGYDLRRVKRAIEVHKMKEVA